MADRVDSRLLGSLLTEHGAALALWATQWTDAPEDAVQDALIKLAAQRIAPDNPVAWLYRAVRNRAISLARSGSRRRRHEAIAARLRPVWEQADESHVDPAAMAEALDALENHLREVVVARVWGRLSFEQIAAAMEISTSTAHRHYGAALDALRERLGATCPNENPTKNLSRR